MAVKSEMKYWIECDKCGDSPESQDYTEMFDTVQEAAWEADECDWLLQDDGVWLCNNCRPEPQGDTDE